MGKYKNIGCLFSDYLKPDRVASLKEKYNLIDIKKIPNLNQIDLLLVFGGDGLMLHGMRNYLIDNNIPVYGVNCGTIGFLLNQFSEDHLMERLNEALPTKLPLLKMSAIDVHGNMHFATAINEVSLFRKTHQAAHISIKINDKITMEKLVADGIMLSTPAGSTAYNFSAGGSILPLNSNILALTAINSFRPRRWRGALLPDNIIAEMEILDPTNRCVTVVSDYEEFNQIAQVKIYKDHSRTITILFDPDHDLEERIIVEQFLF